jgi:SAM-dependent methyltransferase
VDMADQDSPGDTDALADREREHYDAYAANDSSFRFFDSLVHTLYFDRYLKQIPDAFLEDKTVVDLCCGFSRVLRYAAHKGCRQAVGIDISHQMLLRGVREEDLWVYNQKLGYDPRIHFAQGDMNHIPLQDAVADVAIIASALHHLEDKEGFVRTVSRLLKPGGYFIVRDPNGSHYLRQLGNRIGKLWGTLSDDEDSLSYASIVRLLEDHDFEITNVKLFNCFSEVHNHLSEVVYRKSAVLGKLYAWINLLLYPFEVLLDVTLLKLLPNWGWSCLVIGRKPL